MIIISDELMKLEITASSSINDGLSCTLPETNSSHLKMDGWNTFGCWPISRGKPLVSGSVTRFSSSSYWITGVTWSNCGETPWPLDESTYGKIVAAVFQLLGSPGWLKCWIRGTTNPQTYHVTPPKINIEPEKLKMNTLQDTNISHLGKRKSIDSKS